MPAKVKVRILAGRNLPVMDKSSDASDAFVEVKLANTTYKTEVYRRSLNPFWNSEWFKFEVSDQELQDEPLQVRIMDYDTYSANDAIGKVYINLNPLLVTPSKSMSGWLPIYDTLHGIRGEINCMVKVNIFPDNNRFRQSSCGVRFFFSDIPNGYRCDAILGFVDELLVNDDPEYQWIDKIRTPRASNEARQTLFTKLSGEVQRKLGLKAEILGGNAVIGYQQSFDLEGGSGIVGRGIGTAVVLTRVGFRSDGETSNELPQNQAKDVNFFHNDTGYQAHRESTPKHLKHSISADYFYEVPSFDNLHKKRKNPLRSKAKPVKLANTKLFSDQSSTPEYRSLNSLSNFSSIDDKSSESSSSTAASPISSNSSASSSDDEPANRSLDRSQPLGATSSAAADPANYSKTTTTTIANYSILNYSMIRAPKLSIAFKDKYLNLSGNRKLSAQEIFAKFRQNSSEKLAQRLAQSVTFSKSNKLTKLISQSKKTHSLDQPAQQQSGSSGTESTIGNNKKSAKQRGSSDSRQPDNVNDNNPRDGTQSPKRKRDVSRSGSIDDGLSTIEEKLDDDCGDQSADSRSGARNSKMERLKQVDDGEELSQSQSMPYSRSPLAREHSIHDVSEISNSISNSITSLETIKPACDIDADLEVARTISMTESQEQSKSFESQETANKTTSQQINIRRSESVQTGNRNHRNYTPPGKASTAMAGRLKKGAGSTSTSSTALTSTSTTTSGQAGTGSQFVKSVGLIKAQQHLLQNIIRQNNQNLMPKSQQNRARSVFIYPISGDHQSEYPFVTFKKFPPDMVRSIGGVVSVHSVKLLDHIINDEESETRDVWWTEIRKEISCHARALNCNTIIGYTETSKVLSDVCILSAYGTAANLGTSGNGGELAPPGGAASKRPHMSHEARQARPKSPDLDERPVCSPTSLSIPQAGSSPPPTHSFMPSHNNPTNNNNGDPSEHHHHHHNQLQQEDVCGEEQYGTSGNQMGQAATMSSSCLSSPSTTTGNCTVQSNKSETDNNVTSNRESQRQQQIHEQSGAGRRSSTPARSRSRLTQNSGSPKPDLEQQQQQQQQSGFKVTALQQLLDCSLCHSPLTCADSGNLLSKCTLCKLQKVPDFILLTIEPPPNLSIVSKGMLIQARVCRAKRDSHGEVGAKEIGEALPFLEYELHRQLFSKLKFKGLNCLFNLVVDISMGENMISGLATGTGCFVLGLPEPEPPLISGGKGIKTSKLTQIQNLIETTSMKNRHQLRLDLVKAHYLGTQESATERDEQQQLVDGLNDADHDTDKPESHQWAAPHKQQSSSHRNRSHSHHNQQHQQHQHHQQQQQSGQSSTRQVVPSSSSSLHNVPIDASNLHSSNNNNINKNHLLADDNNIVLEVDDSEDANIIALLIDSDVPEGYIVCNSESVPLVDQSSITNINMFTQVMRAKLTSLDQFGHLFDWILQALFVKLRRSLPCCLTNVTYGVDLPESNVVQVTISGCLLALQERLDLEEGAQDLNERGPSSSNRGDSSNTVNEPDEEELGQAGHEHHQSETASPSAGQPETDRMSTGSGSRSGVNRNAANTSTSVSPRTSTSESESSTSSTNETTTTTSSSGEAQPSNQVGPDEARSSLTSKPDDCQQKLATQRLSLEAGTSSSFTNRTIAASNKNKSNSDLISSMLKNGTRSQYLMVLALLLMLLLIRREHPRCRTAGTSTNLIGMLLLTICSTTYRTLTYGKGSQFRGTR